MLLQRTVRAVFKHAETKCTSMFCMYTCMNNCRHIMASLLPLSHTSTNIIFENESISIIDWQLTFLDQSHSLTLTLV